MGAVQSNDQRLLERILEDQHRKLAPDKNRDDFFTFFAADRVAIASRAERAPGRVTGRRHPPDAPGPAPYRSSPGCVRSRQA
ncbi:hypothetical protein JCM18897A_54280 [Streptomyces sp. JCM 18897]